MHIRLHQDGQHTQAEFKQLFKRDREIYPFLFWNIRVYSGFKIKYNKNIIKYE
jgi:hypothetical protein